MASTVNSVSRNEIQQSPAGWLPATQKLSWVAGDPAALKLYADWLNISLEKAKRTRDDFFPPPAIEPDKITGLDTIVKDAVALKFTATELTKEQLAELIRIPPR